MIEEFTLKELYHSKAGDIGPRGRGMKRLAGGFLITHTVLDVPEHEMGDSWIVGLCITHDRSRDPLWEAQFDNGLDAHAAQCFIEGYLAGLYAERQRQGGHPGDTSSNRGFFNRLWVEEAVRALKEAGGGSFVFKES